jgi:hypothetical protein
VPTAIRAVVFDNASWDVTRYDTVTLEYSTNGGGNWIGVPMKDSGGQMFRGTIPGNLLATVQYRVRALDEHGNTGLSSVKSFVSSCSAGVAYCTSSSTSSGCHPSITGAGTPSASASSGFTLTTNNVEGQKSGLIFYGLNGRNDLPWATGSTSILCVKSPLQRTLTANTGGTAGACNGSLSLDWNNFMATNPTSLGHPVLVGGVFEAQAWFRDPPAPKTTNLSNAWEFVACP